MTPGGFIFIELTPQEPRLAKLFVRVDTVVAIVERQEEPKLSMVYTALHDHAWIVTETTTEIVEQMQNLTRWEEW